MSRIDNTSRKKKKKKNKSERLLSLSYFHKEELEGLRNNNKNNTRNWIYSYA